MASATSGTAPDFAPNGLEEAESLLWQRLARASKDRRAPWHTPALATVDADGAPQVRTLVLRAADRATGLVRLHTDHRAGKVRDLAGEPRAQLLFYDKAARLQLRLGGLARVEQAGTPADSAWAAATLFARRCYLAPVAPGAAAGGPTSGLPAALEQREPTADESAEGRRNFSVLLLVVQRLEFLHLAVTGHRRGFMQQSRSGIWTRGWLVP